MKYEFRELYATDFWSFTRKCFSETYPAKRRLSRDSYVRLLCDRLSPIATGHGRRLIINLPPRHLKTRVGAIWLAAWALGRDPSKQVLIVACSEQLANNIAAQIRKLLRSDWYQEVFSTRLLPHRGKVNDFETTGGGGVYAIPVGGAVTGRGADLIIFDDPIEIRDHNNLTLIERVNALFENVIDVAPRRSQARQHRCHCAQVERSGFVRPSREGRRLAAASARARGPPRRDFQDRRRRVAAPERRIAASQRDAFRETQALSQT